MRLLNEFRAVNKPLIIKPEEAKATLLPVTDTQTRNQVVQTPRQPQSPFGFIDVWPSIAGGTVIVWQQNKQFTVPLAADAQLKLEFSYDPDVSDSWLLVSESALVYYLVDSVQRFKGQSVRGSYRLTITSGSNQWVSEPTRLFQKLSFTEYRTALKIIRAENRQIYHKSPGFLLKRRWFGALCPNCHELLTRSAKEDQCLICYGTGYTSGYYKPTQCGMEITLPGSEDKVDPGRGPIDDGHVQARCVALYLPEQNDVWVDSTTANRYRVVSHKVICHQRSVPLVLAVIMKEIPTNDIVYRVNTEV